MKNLSRRGFFKMFGESAMDHIVPLKSGIKGEGDAPKKISLGRIADFPPGTEQRLPCGEGWLVVTSSERGVRAEWDRANSLVSVSLFLNKTGELAVDLDRICKRSSIFSLMTGEMTENEQQGDGNE